MATMVGWLVFIGSDTGNLPSPKYIKGFSKTASSHADFS